MIAVKKFLAQFAEPTALEALFDTTSELEEKVADEAPVIDPKYKAYYLVMHLVGWGSTLIDKVLESKGGDREGMAKYIASIEKDITKFSFVVDNDL